MTVKHENIQTLKIQNDGRFTFQWKCHQIFIKFAT